MTDEFGGSALPLDADGLGAVLDALGVGAAEVWAVLAVETSGCGFLADKRPKILFERHVFSRETSHRFDATDPDISNPVAGGYGQAGAAQYDRLERAMRLDREAALNSTSWGIAQVMGFNATVVGYAGVEAMIAAMKESEGAQVGAMGRFLKATDLDRALRTHAWSAFARGYNGPDYATRHYDTQLGDAYARFAQGALPDLTLRAAQVYLLYLGYQPGPVDGVMGSQTRSAMNAFQADAGAPLTSAPDSETLALLKAEAVGA